MRTIQQPLTRTTGLVAGLLALGLSGCDGRVGAGASAEGDEVIAVGTPKNGEGRGGAGGGSGPGAGGSAPGAGGAGETDPDGGAVAGGDGGMAPASPAAFRCDPRKRSVSRPLPRLSRLQYENTVRDLVAWALKDAGQAAQVLNALSFHLRLLPQDDRPQSHADKKGTFRRADQVVAQSLADAAVDVAVIVAEELSRRERLGLLLGPCAPGADESCVRAFIQRFGSRALRTPLDDEDVAFYRRLYGTDPKIEPRRVAQVVAAIVSSPRFFYHLESGGPAVDGVPRTHALSQVELAARLSYHLWDTMPDDTLWAAATSGALGGARLEAELDRMLADPRAKAGLRRFFEEWLRLEDLPDPAALKDNGVYRTFAGADLPETSLKKAMTDDLLALVDHVLDGGRLNDLFTSEEGFPADERLARIYGVARSVGGAPVRLPGRPGILTRAALLFRASATGKVSPIMRGAFIRRAILCDDVPDPPPDAVTTVTPQAKALPPSATERERVHALTESEGTVCAACHTTLLNPLGYVLGGFDALGRARTSEKIFDERSGKVLAETPVDTRAVPRVVSDDERMISTPAELAALLVESGKPAACAARQYFRYTFGRIEDEALDGCTLERLRAAGERGTLREFLRAVLLDPASQQRTFEP